VLEDFGEPIGRDESRNRRNLERDVPFDGQIGLAAISHALAVRDVPPSVNDGELSSPYDLHCSEDCSIHFGTRIPVSGYQKHVLTDVNPGLVNAVGPTGPVVLALHINIAGVRGGFVHRNVHGEMDDLPAGPERPEMIALDEGPGLVPCVKFMTEKLNQLARRTVLPRGMTWTEGITRS
jgi:hypothetical protein